MADVSVEEARRQFALDKAVHITAFGDDAETLLARAKDIEFYLETGRVPEKVQT